jgi:hypothetical protein
MLWLGVFAVYALVHVFVVKDIFYSHTGTCEVATRLPMGLSKLAMSALNCQLCLAFWIGSISYFVVTQSITMAVLYGLACYGFTAIASKMVDDDY